MRRSLQRRLRESKTQAPAFYICFVAIASRARSIVHRIECWQRSVAVELVAIKKRVGGHQIDAPEYTQASGSYRNAIYIERNLSAELL